jgi:hypothetical protein
MTEQELAALPRHPDWHLGRWLYCWAVFDGLRAEVAWSELPSLAPPWLVVGLDGGAPRHVEVTHAEARRILAADPRDLPAAYPGEWAAAGEGQG